jgi:rhodanese-related sulfurtransferase
MRLLRVRLLPLVALLLFAAGCATTVPTAAVTPSAQGHTKLVEQDPKIAITTQDVMALFKEVYGEAPLVQDTLDKNDKFVLVDARPITRFTADTVPGSIHIPTPKFETDIPKLPKDKPVIFYCGGLTCPFTKAATDKAKELGFTNIRAWYEGEPGWSRAGNYTIIQTGPVKNLVDQIDKGGFALIDSRPHLVNQKEHIPGSISIPWVLWEQKKGLLPTDKDTMLVFYCGGHHCALSHKSAKAALAMGYKKVRVYAEGIPAWKDAGHGTWGNESSGIVEVSTGASDTISAEEFRKGVADGSLFVVDVRSEREYSAGHVPGSVLIPDGEFYNNIEGVLEQLPTDKKVALVCTTGARSGGAFFALLDEMDAGNYKNEKGVQYLPYTVEYQSDNTFEIKK